MGRPYVEYEGRNAFEVVSWGNNAFDFSGEFRAPGREYEMLCFQTLAAQETRHDILLGPNIVNHILGKRNTSWLVKPDMLGFAYVNNGMWNLEALIECKKTKNLGMGRKLDGYTTLLNRLRDNPLYLTSILREFDGGDIPMPRLIGIPEDSDLEVAFISPAVHEHTYFPSSQFAVSHTLIPAY